jgi:hypothetical protein
MQAGLYSAYAVSGVKVDMLSHLGREGKRIVEARLGKLE